MPAAGFHCFPLSTSYVSLQTRGFMHVTVHYLAQIKRAAGCNSELVEIQFGTLSDLMRKLAAAHDANFRSLLLDDVGEPRRSLLFFVGDNHADPGQALNDGDEISILAPMAGG